MAGFFLGLDIGGTNVRIASYDVSTFHVFTTEQDSFKRVGDARTEVDHNVCRPVERLVREKSKKGGRLAGIGLSLAALFDRISGDITMWPNNGTWNGFPLKRYLTDKFRVPILLEDDANAAAVGEHQMGAGRGHRDLAYITISTGIGCGLILRDSLYIGSNGWAGEIGHIGVAEDGQECSCGMRGCLQSIASAPAIVRTFNGPGRTDGHEGPEALDLRDVVSVAAHGNAKAVDVLLQAGAYVGKMIAGLVMTLDLSLIILGGGATGAGDLLSEPVRDSVRRCLGVHQRDVKIVRCHLGDSSGTIGALNLIHQYVNNKAVPVWGGIIGGGASIADRRCD